MKVAALTLAIAFALAALGNGTASAQEGASMDEASAAAGTHTMRVADIVYYVTDFAAARSFYADKLGWEVIFEAPGQYALIDCGGQYRMSLVSAEWSEGWQQGDPAPRAKLSIESLDIEKDAQWLRENNVEVSEIGGDPESMLSASIRAPYETSIILWQDAVEAAAAKAAEEYDALSDASKERYNFGETLLFVESLEKGTEFYTDLIGFTPKFRHGDFYQALQFRDGDRFIGLYQSSEWWDGAVSGRESEPRLVLECVDITAEHKRLSDAGVDAGELKGEAEDLQWFSVADPAGHMVTFWQFNAAGIEAPAAPGE